MPELVRLRDPKTHHEFTGLEGVYDDAEVIDKPAVDANGAPLPAEPHIVVPRGPRMPAGDDAGAAKAAAKKPAAAPKTEAQKRAARSAASKKAAATRRTRQGRTRRSTSDTAATTAAASTTTTPAQQTPSVAHKES